MPQPVYKKILLFLLLVAGVYGIGRTDIIQRNGGSRDMRNRVVGARLMKDGISPYYYHWYPGDSLRYVVDHDVVLERFHRVSSITSSPFFHRVLGPFADYNEPVIERGFYVLFYVLLIAMAVLTWYESKQPLLTLLFFVPFLFSNGWNFHILVGQVYFLFGFLFFIIALAILKKKYVLAGIIFAFLVLLRLNCILFLIPFLLAFRQYKVFIFSFVSGLAVYGIVLACSPFERENWKDYFAALHDYTEIHLAFLSPDKPAIYTHQSVDIEPLLPKVFEGQDLAEAKRLKATTPELHQLFDEPSNFFMIYKALLHKGPSVLLLNALLGCSIAFISGLLLLKRRKCPTLQQAPEPLILAGLLMYGLSFFLSPIITFPYQMPQWMAVAALAVIFYRKLPKGLLLLFLGGILLNLFFLPDVDGMNAGAEIIFMATTFCMLLWGKWYPRAEKVPAMGISV